MRRLVVLALVPAMILLPGIRLGTLPLFTIFLASLLYLPLFRPALSLPQARLTLAVFCYFLLVCSRNALMPEGGLREIFYLCLPLAPLFLHAMVKDWFDHGHGRLTVMLLAVLTMGNALVMLAQSLNLGGINQSLLPVWRFYAALTDSQPFLGQLDNRPFGLLSNPMTAGMVTYLAMRAAAVLSGRRWLVFLALPIMLLAASRMSLALFLAWEILLPLLLDRPRLRRLVLLGGAAAFVLALLALAGQAAPQLFIFQALATARSLDGLASDYSLVNRLDSLDWALGHLDKALGLGGLVTAEFSRRAMPVDSEFLLRSLQFGVTGYLLLVLLVYFPLRGLRNRDARFALVFMLAISLTNAAASNLLLLPFLSVYILAVRKRHPVAVPEQPPSPSKEPFPERTLIVTYSGFRRKRVYLE